MSRRKSINSNRETIPPALLQAQADAARAGLPSTSSCAWMLAGRGSAKCVFWESWRWASAPSHEVGIRGALSRLVDYNIKACRAFFRNNNQVRTRSNVQYTRDSELAAAIGVGLAWGLI